MAMNGPFFLSLPLCIAWANSSLPVPLSPRISTLETLRDAVLQSFLHSITGAESPIIESSVYRAVNPPACLTILRICFISSRVMTIPPLLPSELRIVVAATLRSTDLPLILKDISLSMKSLLRAVKSTTDVSVTSTSGRGLPSISPAASPSIRSASMLWLRIIWSWSAMMIPELLSSSMIAIRLEVRRMAE